MTEQDRIYINEDNFKVYEKIYNAKNLEEARMLALQEMKIIQEDIFIENDEEGKIIELADANLTNS